MSHEYIGAIVILVGGILKAFGIEIGNDSIEGILTGIIALYIAIRRFQKGDISVLGKRK
jgi:uncharacterized membrane protein